MRIFKFLTWWFCLAGVAYTSAAAQLAGIGVVLTTVEEKIVINSIQPGGSASANKDLHKHDQILAVAQGDEAPVSLRGVKLAQAVAMIRGPLGTKVRLTVVSAGEDESKPRVLTFERVDIVALGPWGDGILLTNGMKAPDIEMMPLPNAALEHLTDYAGKIVVLEFWATWCGPCQVRMAEMQLYPAKYPEWKDQVLLISASVDDDAKVADKHLQAKGWNQMHNTWVTTPAIQAYHIRAIPAVYVIDRGGNILAANPRDLAAVVNQALQMK